MEISVRKSNFSQFSRDLWMVAEHGGTRIDFDIGENELKDYALMFLDLVDECLDKHLRNKEIDRYEIGKKIVEVMEMVEKLEA